MRTTLIVLVAGVTMAGCPSPGSDAGMREAADVTTSTTVDGGSNRGFAICATDSDCRSGLLALQCTML